MWLQELGMWRKKIGDTLTLSDEPATEMLPGYKEVRLWYLADYIRWTPQIMRN